MQLREHCLWLSKRDNVRLTGLAIFCVRRLTIFDPFLAQRRGDVVLIVEL